MYDDICLDVQLFYSKKIQKELKYLYAKDIHNLAVKDIIELRSSKLIDTVSYNGNKLNLFCSDSIINGLNITIMKDVKIFINEKRYKLLNNRPVIKE